VKKAGKDLTPLAEKAENIANNKKRIAKMKEMYSMFVKMEGGKEDGPDQDEEEDEN
jgi:hypothetical protein